MIHRRDIVSWKTEGPIHTVLGLEGPCHCSESLYVKSLSNAIDNVGRGVLHKVGTEVLPSVSETAVGSRVEQYLTFQVSRLSTQLDCQQVDQGRDVALVSTGFGSESFQLATTCQVPKPLGCTASEWLLLASGHPAFAST